jgi:hypothetical protein
MYFLLLLLPRRLYNVPTRQTWKKAPKKNLNLTVTKRHIHLPMSISTCFASTSTPQVLAVRCVLSMVLMAQSTYILMA